VPGFWWSAQLFGNIMAILKPVVRDFYEHFPKQGSSTVSLGGSMSEDDSHLVFLLYLPSTRQNGLLI
jgi:hypothetical protein